MLIVAISSCNDDILKFDDYESKIVVDGWIEQGQVPIVALTKSSSYFTELYRKGFENLVVTEAKVTVSDGTIEELLTLKDSPLLFPEYAYHGNLIKGEIGKTYHLKVEYNGKTVTAFTTIPNPVALDSVWFELAEGKSKQGLIWIKFTDDENTKDYYKAITQEYEDNSNIISNFFSVFDDKYFSGETIESPLYNHNTNILSASKDMYFQKGDSVQLKFTTIDEASHKFWYSYTKEMLNGQNPFAAANSKVESNINNGLGIWCGYGVKQYVVYNK